MESGGINTRYCGPPGPLYGRAAAAPPRRSSTTHARRDVRHAPPTDAMPCVVRNETRWRARVATAPAGHSVAPAGPEQFATTAT